MQPSPEEVAWLMVDGQDEETTMISMHQTHRSEWDDSYINLRLSADDARWAVVVIVAFAIAALLA